LPSHSRSAVVWLAVKEWRELAASRAWWVMFVAAGPIVGIAFRTAVTTYADVSADPGCGIACSPLLGIWAPTFSAFEIVAIFLLPFVAIRSLTGDRQSGALTLELQRPFPIGARIAIKIVVVAFGWAIAFAAAAIAIGLWASYGGHVWAPELVVVVFGHTLNALLTIAVALAIAAMTDHPSTAAIVTLAITIGTWMLDFAAAVYGGIWERLAGYTPSAFVAAFQHGLVRANAVLIALVLILGAMAIAAVWTRPGVPSRRRMIETAGLACSAVLAAWTVSFVPGSWDASETRINSFDERDEEALERIAQPIQVDVRLAPQDPRRVAFERGPLAKLRRVHPQTRVSFIARTATGLYEQADAGYGEIRCRVGDRTGVTRAVTDEALVETILGAAAVSRLGEMDLPYRGHPHSVHPAGAAAVFFLMWPVVTAGSWIVLSRRHS
jgi:ABC-2 type transport system permease protein